MQRLAGLLTLVVGLSGAEPASALTAVEGRRYIVHYMDESEAVLPQDLTVRRCRANHDASRVRCLWVSWLNYNDGFVYCRVGKVVLLPAGRVRTRVFGSPSASCD